MYNPTLRVHLIDTPGFDDTNVSDAQVLQNIAHWLSMSFKYGIKLSGIIYLHRITDPRMTGSVRRNLLMFKKLCGEKSFSSVVLATTRWSMVDEATGIAHEEELKNTEAFWGHMYKKGSKVFRHTGSNAGMHTGSRDSALALTGYILNLHTTVTLRCKNSTGPMRKPYGKFRTKMLQGNKSVGMKRSAGGTVSRTVPSSRTWTTADTQPTRVIS